MFLINNTIKIYSKLVWLQSQNQKAVFYKLQKKYPANQQNLNRDQLYEKFKMAQ